MSAARWDVVSVVSARVNFIQRPTVSHSQHSLCSEIALPAIPLLLNFDKGRCAA